MLTARTTVGFRLYPNWGQRVLRRQTPGEPGSYSVYAHQVGRELRDAAIKVYTVSNKKTNEARTSEFTPPKYISSFRIEYQRTTFNLFVRNTDPGWALVEWGAHPGGDPDTFVLRYKPMTRALIIVGLRQGGV